MLATKSQIKYLQYLTDRAEYIRQTHPSLIPQGLTHTIWGIDMTSEKASARINYYNAILSSCNRALFDRKKVAEIEDIPA